MHEFSTAWVSLISHSATQKFRTDSRTQDYISHLAIKKICALSGTQNSINHSATQKIRTDSRTQDYISHLAIKKNLCPFRNSKFY